MVDLYEFEASLVYRASSKTARVTQRKTVSKKQKTPLPSKRKKKRKKKKKKEKANKQKWISCATHPALASTSTLE